MGDKTFGARKRYHEISLGVWGIITSNLVGHFFLTRMSVTWANVPPFYQNLFILGAKISQIVTQFHAQLKKPYKNKGC